MHIYYSDNGVQHGPIDEAELARLVETGIIRADTYLWWDGLSEWQPYGVLAGAAQPTEEPVAAQPVQVAQPMRATAAAPVQAVRATAAAPVQAVRATAAPVQAVRATAAPVQAVRATAAAPVQAVRATAAPVQAVRATAGAPVQAVRATAGAPVQMRAAPQTLGAAATGAGVATNNVEAVRAQNLNHEGAVRSIGLLYYLSGGFASLGGLGLLVAAIRASERAATAGLLGAAVVLLAIGVLQVFVGTAVRDLRPWARIPIGILSGLGLLGFPVGTLIHGYILYLVFSEKGQQVFSDQYRLVREQTPHVKSRTSPLVWILLGIFAVGLIFACIAGVSAFKAMSSTATKQVQKAQPRTSTQRRH